MSWGAEQEAIMGLAVGVRALERSKLRLRQHVRHRLPAFWSKRIVPETAKFREKVQNVMGR